MPRRPHNLAAFSLLELVLVMMILAILAGMAAPSLRGFSRGRQASLTADQIITLTRWARTQAISQGMIHRLTLDPAKGTYWVSLENNSNEQTITSDLGRTFHVPEGVQIESDVALENGQYVIRFYPAGRTDAATIRLRQGDQVVEVSSPSASEGYRLVKTGEGI